MTSWPGDVEDSTGIFLPIYCSTASRRGRLGGSVDIHRGHLLVKQRLLILDRQVFPRNSCILFLSHYALPSIVEGEKDKVKVGTEVQYCC